MRNTVEIGRTGEGMISLNFYPGGYVSDLVSVSNHHRGLSSPREAALFLSKRYSLDFDTLEVEDDPSNLKLSPMDWLEFYRVAYKVD